MPHAVIYIVETFLTLYWRTVGGLKSHILLVRVYSSFTPIAKARVTPSHTFPDWQERSTDAYGNKHRNGDSTCCLRAQPPAIYTQYTFANQEGSFAIELNTLTESMSKLNNDDPFNTPRIYYSDSNVPCGLSSEESSYHAVNHLDQVRCSKSEFDQQALRCNTTEPGCSTHN